MRPYAVLATFGLAAAAGGLALRVAAGTSLDDPVLGLVETAWVATGVALVLLRWRPGHRMGPIFAVTATLFGVSALASAVLGATDGGSVAAEAAFAWIWLTQAPLVWMWALVILALPDGRLGRARRRFLAAAGVVVGVLATVQYLLAPTGRTPEFPPADAAADLAGPLRGVVSWEPLFDVGPVVFALVPLLAIAGLVVRFRRGDTVVRQQLKWFLAAAVATVVVNVLRVPLDAAGGDVAGAGAVLGLAAEPLPAVGIALAVLRYRLWELDVLLSRALVYGLLWAVLAATFLTVALAAGLLAGGTTVLVPVTLALLVALAGEPLRTRLERLVRRLVYGEEPSGYAVVVRFGEMLAEAAGTGELAPRLAESVRRALAVSWTGVWLRVESDRAVVLRPAAVAGAEGGVPLMLSEDAAAWLCRLREPVLAPDAFGDLAPAVLAPLWAGDDLVGVLLCGEPAGRTLGEPDLELLAVLAREAALALRNARLEAELWSRLAEIEAQAEELRRSRRRLVGAQDEERRRIERDLHDGVQQQLVSLTAKLARASRIGGTDVRRLLREAAADAEEVVFALQELGRGIYPSLLADRGLAEALRTHANRLPADVRVEVEPALAGARFDADLELALYFVALEAMTNAQKHAASAGLTVSLRSGGSGRRLVLEVHDDGPGFGRGCVARGSGLQNMEDRIAAAGGTLTVDSRAGAGTWVRAEVPLEARVVPLQRPAGDSRR